MSLVLKVLMGHVTQMWMDASRYTHMRINLRSLQDISRFEGVHESCHTHVNGCVMWMDGLCHTHENRSCVCCKMSLVLKVWMRHVTQMWMDASCHTHTRIESAQFARCLSFWMCEGVMSRIFEWMGHVTQIWMMFCVFRQMSLVLNVWMGYAIFMWVDASCHTHVNGCVMWVDESCHTHVHGWVMSRTCERNPAQFARCLSFRRREWVL